MKTNELKKVLKPLIKQCIKECIFEEGVLSGIITEVVKGMDTRPVMVESSVSRQQAIQEQNRLEEEHEQQRQERIRRLNESMKTQTNDVNVFEGTSPIAAEGSQHSPLAGVQPGDSGVDISALVSTAGRKWKHLI